MDKIIDFSSCIASGGDNLRPRIEQACQQYSPMSEEYFNRILSKSGRTFTESACGFLLLDNLLAKHGIDTTGLVISRNGDGRPCLINRFDVDFSISHSDGGVMCALMLGDEARVGCDIQCIRPYTPDKLAALAEIFMPAADFREFLTSCSEQLFYTIWTRREAYIKHSGGDVFNDLRDINFHADGYRTGVIKACDRSYYYSIFSE